MCERAQNRLSNFAIRRSFWGFVILASTVGFTSCSSDGAKDGPPPEVVEESVAPDLRPWRTEYRGDIAATLASQKVRQCDEFRYLEESTDPRTYLIECSETGDQFHVIPSRGEVTSTLKLETPVRSRSTSSSPQANPEDMRQARKFLADLPPACSRSYISVATDRTVVIHVSCTDSTRSRRDEIRIKNGIVTDLR